MRFLLIALLLAQFPPVVRVYPPDGIGDGSGFTPIPPASTLTSGLVSCWKLDEATGLTRVDSCGSADLDEGGTTDVTVVTGIDGNGIVIPSGNPSSCLSRAVVDLGTAYTINIWVDNWTSSVAMLNGQVQIGYGLGSFQARNIAQGGDATCSAPHTADGDYHMMTMWYDAAGDSKIHCSVDAGTEYVAVDPYTQGAYSGILYVGGSGCAFQFGKDGVDELTMWDRPLTAAERTELLTAFVPY
jgi:hypothetical protein